MSHWNFATRAGARVAALFIPGFFLWVVPASTIEPVATTSWVGETIVNDRATFVRVGPQILSGPEPFLHLSNELVFNQALREMTADETTISFETTGDDTAPAMRFSGTFDRNHYSGVVSSADGNGSFVLFPTVSVPDKAVLSTYVGTYEVSEGNYRTVGYEDLAGMIETRLYYSDGEDFVLLYPLSETDFMTGLGERIRFDTERDKVSRMTIRGREGESIAPKVELFSEFEVSYASKDVEIAGTLMVPTSPGPHPAVIIAHSSGIGERHGYWQFASQFAQDGLAVLIYDRRGHGLSTGGQPFNLDTNLLAEDMKAGFSFLQSRSDIDPKRIGLMGFSNGSWVAPLAARDLPDVAFISVSMASGVSQVDAEMFRRASVLRAVGVSDDSIAQAVEALELYFKGGVSGFSDVEASRFAALYEAVAENEELRAAQGFNILPTETPLEEILSAGGSMSFMGFSPTDIYQGLDAPISFHVGELDENIPISLTRPAMEALIARRPDADITFLTYPDALHGLFIPPAPVKGISQDLLYPNLASYAFAPGYIPRMRSWLKRRSGLNTDHDADPGSGPDADMK